MSRMYRIRVSETVERMIHVDDGVATDLELLPVLERPRMLDLLGDELARRGFTRDGTTATRTEADGVAVTVDLQTGRVTAQVTSTQEVTVEGERTAAVYRDADDIRQDLRSKLTADLERDIDTKRDALQKEATARLEHTLRDLRGEMDQVVHRVTATALKARAGQLGEIEELSENAETGELTIKVKV